MSTDRLVVDTMRRTETSTSATPVTSKKGPVATGLSLLLREVAHGVWPLLTLGLFWMALYLIMPRNSFLKSPVDVGSYLLKDGNFGVLAKALSMSLGLVVLGYLVATVFSIVLAALVVSSKTAGNAVMPIAVLIGSVPIIVITPVMLMLFGRGILTAVLVCTIVTFFPCLISIIAGMRSPGPQLIDLTRALGASSLQTLIKIRFPSSVPSLISASKLALPAALSGVILTEFIATGTGIGNYINHGRANFLFNEMWAGIAATLAASVLLYSILGALEILLQRRYAPLDVRGGSL